MKICNHGHMRAVTIFVMPEKPEQDRLAVLSISCDVCGARFKFATGDSGICFNDGRTELSVWVTERGE
jgi:uncharacterized membrane protein